MGNAFSTGSRGWSCKSEERPFYYAASRLRAPASPSLAGRFGRTSAMVRCMAQCPACEADTFDNNSRCSTCGYQEVYELPLEAIDDAEPLSLDDIEPFA